MSKRVYEIARELSVSTKEVMRRLSEEEGIEVNNHFASVEDGVYQRILGDSNGKKEQEPETPRKAPSGESRQSRKRRRVVIDSGASTGQSQKPSAPAQPSKKKSREPAAPVEESREERPGVARVEPGATVKDVADALGVNSSEVIKALMNLGEMKTVTQTLSPEETELVADEFGQKVEIESEPEEQEENPPEDSPEELAEKPPVVTVMGHVDHGKTSLLDRIRRENVAGGESGGITQHIGAYQVEAPDGRRVTFVDTPGHEAFTEMRARGAQVTDVVVLVVAADDGVMPQTREAIEHARAAGVPIVVAVNKIDVPRANPDRALGDLSEEGLVPETYGGETVTTMVSAKSGEGIEDLLDNILVVAELEDLKSNPGAEASGYVIEGQRDPGRGPVATLLITRGTLRRGDVIVADTAYGRVRAMMDHARQRIEKAAPGTPVEVLGLSGVPAAGTRFEVTGHERQAREMANRAGEAQRRRELAESGPRRSLEELVEQGGVQNLNLVIKADVAGAVEALKDALGKLSTGEVKVNIVRSGVGAITDSDVMLASASDGTLIGFNVRPTTTARQTAETEGVEIRTYSVIYKAVEEMEAAMRGMLSPKTEERHTATAEVRQVFRVSKAGTIAGCYVSDGEVSRGNRVRVLREGAVVYESNIASLKRYTEDVRTVREGFECGVSIENFNDIKEGDLLEFFEVVEVPR